MCLVISKQKDYVKKFLAHDEALEEEMKNEGKFGLLKELNEIIDNMEFTFIYQGKKRGTGAALYYAKEWTNGKPFAFMYGDDFCKNNKKPVIGQLMKAYEKTGKTVVGAKQVPLDDISKYSSIKIGKKLFDRCNEMIGIIEKPKKEEAPSNLSGMARYVFTQEIFDEIPKCKPSANGEVYLTDAIERLAQKGRTVCFEFDGKYFDGGNKLEFIKCVIDNGLDDKEFERNLREYLKSI